MDGPDAVTLEPLIPGSFRLSRSMFGQPPEGTHPEESMRNCCGLRARILGVFRTTASYAVVHAVLFDSCTRSGGKRRKRCWINRALGRLLVASGRGVICSDAHFIRQVECNQAESQQSSEWPSSASSGHSMKAQSAASDGSFLSLCGRSHRGTVCRTVSLSQVGMGNRPAPKCFASGNSGIFVIH